ncbi:MAG: LapA family protein [Burkholderiales bacterium]
MRTLGWIVLGGLVLLAFFALANWPLLTAPATLNFIAFTVQGPLGLILLGVTVAFAALFAIYALSLRTSALVETRRHLRELEAQRELADKAEASRFTALGVQLEREAERLRAIVDATRAEMKQRADDLEASLKASFTETGNALFANIGQIDDKLNRIAPRSDDERAR